MKLLFVVMLVFIISLPKSFAKSKYGFGVSFSPSLSFVSFKGDELIVKMNEDLFKSYANSILLNGTFFLERKYSRVAFGIAMGYKRLREETETALSNNSEQTSLLYNHDYGTIPIYVRLNITKKFYIKPGITSLVNINNTVTTITEDIQLGTTSEIVSAAERVYKALNFSGDISFGYTFVNKKIKMDIEPVFSKNILGLLKGKLDANSFQSAFGISMNIRI